jgi:predicted RND superfamily exporter protein
MTGIASRVGEFLTTYTKSIILVVLVLTVAVGAGVGGVEQQSNTDQFESDSPEANAQAFIEENMTVDEGENTTLLQVLQRGDNVLTKAAVNESLTLQQQVFEQEAITQTLTEERPVFGYANVIGSAAVRQQSADPENATAQPTLAEQRQAVLALGDEAFETLVADVFGEDASQEVLGLLPATYTPGDTTAEGGLTVFRQQVDQEVQNPNEIEPAITDAQLAIRGLANDLDSDYAVFGQGILSEEINNSLADSGGIVGPLALLFVVVALTVAYRDLLDIVLGVVGIVAVLVWTFGFMGWAGVAFNHLLLAVPVLLIGLSIDYAIHVFMRYREQRAEGDDVGGRRAMALALADSPPGRDRKSVVEGKRVRPSVDLGSRDGGYRVPRQPDEPDRPTAGLRYRQRVRGGRGTRHLRGADTGAENRGRRVPRGAWFRPGETGVWNR